jgi:flagellar biosynthesis protein FlhF
MKIKRHMADSMRAALAKVRAEQGPDAVILSSRRVEEGIEVIAAVDYDEGLFVGAPIKRAATAAPPALSTLAPNSIAVSSARRAAAAATASRAAPPANAPALAPAAAPPAAAVADAAAAPPAAAEPAAAALAATSPAAAAPAVRPTGPRTDDGGFRAIQQEVKDLRELLQGELAHLSWHDKRLREPLQARVLEEFTALDIAPDVAKKLAGLAPSRTSLENPAHIPLALLVRHLPVVDRLSTVDGGVIALVGPTGAGKTTTIAKLAARWSMQHGSEDLALVSTDGYRIGAREQLMTYSRILGARMYIANSGKELARVLERLQSKKLVLIDTAGMGPRDARLSEQLAALQLGAAGAKVYLTLPAQGEVHALEEIVRSFGTVNPAACILTKVDESASLGAAISTTLRHELPIAYLGTGQRVPEDLHAAHVRKVWLIHLAIKLKNAAPPNINERYLARHFAGATAHA